MAPIPCLVPIPTTQFLIYLLFGALITLGIFTYIVLCRSQAQGEAEMIAYPVRTREAMPSRAPLDPMRIESVLNDAQDKVMEQPVESTSYAHVETEDQEPKEEADTEDSDSVATSASTVSSNSTGRKRRACRRPRPPCKKYTPEQGFFIWYLRMY
ncbi:hypothetical protein H2200_008388 [Cladophialophora chaetospira]|uniref:Uncharacterized protein n=1 Tax=Cladophialophora chaetospira TaxID=386627 RepID=A0AA39CGF3_9EURO|nr:hypothetical protein H2200_008388 [Cladophialophora chaetospira]